MAGLIPQSFIDDLLARADIVDVVGSRITLKKTGKNYSGLCPFHQEKSPSFTVEPGKQFYYCFGCGAGGNSLGFVMNYENLEFPQAIESLARTMGMEVPYEESPQQHRQREKKQTLYDMMDKVARFYQLQLRQHPQKARAVDYLKNRGLTGAIAKDFGLGFAPAGWDNLLKELGDNDEHRKLLLDGGMIIEKENPKNPYHDRFRERIMYPIRDSRGRIIGFGGRVLGDDKPKYLNSPETPIFRKGEELYGLYEARQKTRHLERVLIVEGYMDVIALAQHELCYAVATLGTATSTAHLQRLFKLVPEVVFCFDGDSAGRQAAWRALEQTLPLMKDGLTARFLFLPEGEDPDTQIRKVGKECFEQDISRSRQLAEFFFESLGEQVDMQSLEGRARLGSLAMPLIKKIPGGIYKQLFLDKLAEATGTTADALQKIAGLPPSSNSNPTRPAAFPGKNRILSGRKVSGLPICKWTANLILRNPSIVKNVNHSGLENVEAPDISLLHQVIALAQKYPDSRTPDLLGRVLASPFGNQLHQLATLEVITPADNCEEEYSGIISQLISQASKKRATDALLEQARQKLQSRAAQE